MPPEYDESARFQRRRSLLLGAAAAALPFGFPASAQAARAPLVVGGLAVTCNLTLPIACVARGAEAGAMQFEYSKYNGWPEVKESLMAGRIPAAGGRGGMSCGWHVHDPGVGLTHRLSVLGGLGWASASWALFNVYDM